MTKLNKTIKNKSTAKIKWESWNTKETEHIQEKKSKSSNKNNPFSSDDEEAYEYEAVIENFICHDNIITPFGVFPASSMLKPTDRWDCWVGHTNFCITNGIANKINKEVDGVAALSILDKYTFCVGISKSFELRYVMGDIENKLGVAG